VAFKTVLFGGVVVGILLIAYFWISTSPDAGWEERARDRGWAEAERDIVQGKLRLKTYGCPIEGEQEDAKRLKQRFAVEWKRVAGCCVTKEFAEEVEAYNERMNQEISVRFGADALDKARPEIHPVGRDE
jgi:hypothetical protein